MNRHPSTTAPECCARLAPVEPPLVRLVVQAIDRAPISLSLSDRDGNLLYANDQFWALFAHEPGTLLRIADLSRPDDRTWTAAYMTQLVSGKRDAFESVKRFVRGDGTEFDGDVSIRPVVDEAGECVAMIASVTPAETRPKIQDVKARKLLEYSPSTLTLLDDQGEIVETTGRYRATLGYPAEFWEHRSVFDLLVPEELERALAMRERVLVEPGVDIVEDFRVIGANRQIETLEVTATNLFDDPDIRGVLVMSRNVTDDRANRRAVDAQHDDAVEEAARRSNLLATVSHEIRNPLHAMGGMAELLASDPGLTGPQHDLALAIQRQLNRLANVADDLLDTARLDVGEYRLRPSTLVVTAEVADDVPFAMVIDGARLQQVLGNLLGNAVKFTDAGSVTLRVDRRDEVLVFRVADTGPGIPGDHLDQVFQPFATVPGSGHRRGAGLGLAVVSRVVDAMEGTIGIDSEVGSGTTFTIELPLVETEAPLGRAEPRDAAHQRHAARRVLVIEDTPVNQDLARAQLTRLGHDCEIVGSAEDGLAFLERETVDAVLMDHQLPGMNGREATVEMRRRGWSVPVIGVTASSTAADERACFDAGMDAFLPKPVGLARLTEALEAVWTGSSAASRGVEPDRTGGAADHSVLDTLADELGDRATVEQLVRSFLAELDARSADILGADDTLAARQAHTLKSSAALLGAIELAEACAAAEHDRSRRTELASLVDHARAGLHAWLDPEGDT